MNALPLIDQDPAMRARTQRPFTLYPDSIGSSDEVLPHSQTRFLEATSEMNHEISLEAQSSLIRTAVAKLFQTPKYSKMVNTSSGEYPSDSCYVKEIFPSYVVCEKGGDLYSIPYSLDGTVVELGEPEKVRVQYASVE